MELRVKWLVLITVSDRHAFAPEAFLDQERGAAEAERWVEYLRSIAGRPSSRVLPGRWVAGDFIIRLVRQQVSVQLDDELWVGTAWDAAGYPSPEAILFTSREAAREWAMRGGLIDLPADRWTVRIPGSGTESAREISRAKLVLV